MRTLAEPKQNVAKLWGKQKVKPEETYRLMRYVLRVDHEGKTALHNVVTGQLVVLDADEVQAVDALPAGYSPIMDALIADHYLVLEGYDEHKQVVNLRTILRSLMPKSKYITHYTILPTTACNARCYYCFEQGIKPVTMTEKTAEHVVKFITDHCGPEKKVSITWFGGEPTVASNRIDQICNALQSRGITFSSKMYSNGYLFDEAMVQKAKEQWHLNHVQMSIDGTETIFNNVKAFVNPKDNPYQRVMRNIGLLLKKKISVSVRMNVDYFNHEDFQNLVKDLKGRHYGHKLLSVYAYFLIGEHPDHNGVISHASDEWIASKVVELCKYARSQGFGFGTTNLPSLRYTSCMADDNSNIVINADATLVKCLEQVSAEQVVGTLADGITNSEKVSSWQEQYDFATCNGCPYYPRCVQLTNCGGAGHCYQQGNNTRYEFAIKDLIHTYNTQKGGDSNEI